MNSFTILPNQSWYTDPTTETRQQGRFITQSVNAYYHSDYHGGDAERRNTVGTVENIITTLKNQFQDKSVDVLNRAGQNLIQILRNDLPEILQLTGNRNLTVAIVPRVKAQTAYFPNQLLFKKAVKMTIDHLDGFSDGTNYILRHTNTRTTHLERSGYGGDGDLPYPGITKITCTISSNVNGKNILLIDDLYTVTINIDEDPIQALLDEGANSVVFYALGKTARRQHDVL